MFNRNKSTLFYLFLVVVASVMVGMVLASRLDLSSQSSAQTLAVPAVNSSPITGPVTATTFREVANVVSICSTACSPAAGARGVSRGRGRTRTTRRRAGAGSSRARNWFAPPARASSLTSQVSS